MPEALIYLFKGVYLNQGAYWNRAHFFFDKQNLKQSFDVSWKRTKKTWKCADLTSLDPSWLERSAQQSSQNFETR